MRTLEEVDADIEKAVKLNQASGVWLNELRKERWEIENGKPMLEELKQRTIDAAKEVSSWNDGLEKPLPTPE